MKPVALLFLLASFACFAGSSDWPQWLGPTRDAHAATTATCPDKIPAELKPLWRKSIGSGFSSPVVANGKLVYFDENGQKEVAHLLDANDGKELWKAEIADRYVDEWSAGPRSTPLMDGDRVYVLSCNGEFRCLKVEDGKPKWGFSFEKDFGVKFVGSKAQEGTAARRGNNGSSVIDGNEIIIPVGSTNGATLVCFDKNNGKLVWKSGSEEAAYSSPQVATLAGRRQVIYLSADSLSGFDRADGKVLWRIPLKTAAKRHAATPLIVGDNVIVNSHTFGLLCFKVQKNGDTVGATQLWANKMLKINLATPVVSGDFLFSHGPARNFICADVHTGALKWEQPGFGNDNSSTILVGKKLLVLTDAGELVVVDANPEKYSEQGRLQLCGKNWNFPALADGKFYVRDSHELICYPFK